MCTVIADSYILIGASTSSAQDDRVVLEAIKAAGKKRKADWDSTAGIDMEKNTGILYAYIYLQGLMYTIHDKECISREFGVGYQSFDPKESVSIM